MKESLVDLEGYREKGYTIVRGLFRPDVVLNIQQDCRRIFEYQMDGESSDNIDEFEQNLFNLFAENRDLVINCGKQCQHLVSLHRLSLDERILSIVRDHGITFPNISTRPVLFFNSRYLAKKEVIWKVFAHQDWASMQGSLNSIVVWLPLMDVNINLGALEVVPGSHLDGLVSEGKEAGFGKVNCYDDSDFEPVEVNAGDALFFSSFLVHRSGTNVTDRIRWSCHFRYNDLDEVSYIRRGFPNPYIYKPIDELVTPGFPTVGEVRAVFKEGK